MNIFIKVHRCEFLRITTKVQKEVKQWVKAKCEQGNVATRLQPFDDQARKHHKMVQRGLRKEC